MRTTFDTPSPPVAEVTPSDRRVRCLAGDLPARPLSTTVCRPA